MTVYKRIAKPFFDFTLSLVAILIVLPFLLILTILLFAYNSGSPFFLHNRPGKNGRIFKIIKFKTMNENRDENGNLLPDAQRLTSIGRFMRQTSLDEMPQLINVLKGDMSLVGPRPLAVEYLQLYNDFQKRRHEVKPGITGLAQVKGRNLISWEQKFKLDVWYVDNISFLLDMKIICQTIIKVLKREGIGLRGSTMGSLILESFKGNEKI
jgi:undecaprenyl phosphate N,N'-diacetylbacillosamine 1-phosphate transferase